MGSGQSHGISSFRAELIDEQPEQVKHELILAMQRDDPILFQQVMESNRVSLQEKIHDGTDRNWTMLHYAASTNAERVIDAFLNSRLSVGQLPFDIINSLDNHAKRPLQVAYDQNSFEAFEALLRCCAKHDHKIKAAIEFDSKREQDKRYNDAIQSYKSKTIKLEKRLIGKVNMISENDDHITINNQGNIPEIFKEKLAQLNQTGRFKDRDFRNIAVVVEDPRSTQRTESSSTVPVRAWFHIKDCLKRDFTIFSKGGFYSNTPITSINPNLNFLFCAFNEFPYCLNRVFHSRETNEKGLLSLVLFHNGVPNLVLLDEYFPCNKTKENMLFQKPYNGEIWPSVIEKGLAKAYGGYQKIANLDLIELLETTLGAPVKGLKISSFSTSLFWRILQDFEENKYLMFIGLKQAKELSFFLTGVYVLNGKRTLRLKACSPGLTIEGALPDDFADDDMRRALGYQTQADGCFFVELEYFVQRFEKVVISYFSEHWNRTAVVSKNFGSKIENFELDIARETRLFLSFAQDAPTNNEASPLHFILVHKDGDTYHSIAHGDANCRTGAKVCYILDERDLNLKPGKYMVQVKAISKSAKSTLQGTLIAYSTQPILLSPIKNKELLEDVFMSFGKASEHKEVCGEDCYMTSGWWSIYYWIYFENNSGSNWEIDVNFMNICNVKIGKPFRTGPESLRVMAKKGEKHVAYFLKKNPAKVADFKLDMEHFFYPIK